MLRFATIPSLFASLLACSLLGCSGPQFEHVRVEKQTIETQPLSPDDQPQPIAKVDLATFNGSIDVRPHDLSVVSMEVSYKAYGESEEEAAQNAEDMRCDYALENGGLSIKAVKPANQWRASASFKLLVPRGCSVVLDTSNGTVTVRELEAAVSVETSNGSVSCIDVTGDIQVKTSNGTIKVEDCEGTLNAKTSNGKVNFSGRLSGDENRIQTSNGTVVVALDPTQLVDIESDTSNGRIQCSLSTQKVTQESKKHFYGLVGDGSEEELVKLSIKTSNGSIKIDPIRDDKPGEQPTPNAEVDSGEAIAL